MQRQQDRHFLVMEGEAEAEEDVKNVEVEVEGEEEQGGGEEMGSISPTDPPVTCLLSHPPADHSTHLIPIRK